MPELAAHNLLDEFHNLGATLAASRASKLRVVGCDERVVDALAVFRAAMIHVLHGEMSERPILSTWPAMLDYLRATMAFDRIERVRVLHLNTRRVLLRDEIVSEGTIDEAVFYIREVLRRAIDLGSAAIIVVHNHPSGDPTPSAADIDITRKLAEAGKRLGVSLHDHIIVAARGHTSLRAMGLL